MASAPRSASPPSSESQRRSNPLMVGPKHRSEIVEKKGRVSVGLALGWGVLVAGRSPHLVPTTFLGGRLTHRTPENRLRGGHHGRKALLFKLCWADRQR